MICQLCQEGKIINSMNGVSSNLMRHMKRFHMSRLVTEKLVHHKMSTLAAKMTETDLANEQDAEDEEERR